MGTFKIEGEYGVNLVSPQYRGKAWKYAYMRGDELILKESSCSDITIIGYDADDVVLNLSYGGNIKDKHVELVTEQFEEDSGENHNMLVKIEITKNRLDLFSEFKNMIKEQVIAATRRNARTRKQDPEDVKANFFS